MGQRPRRYCEWSQRAFIWLEEELADPSLCEDGGPITAKDIYNVAQHLEATERTLNSPPVERKRRPRPTEHFDARVDLLAKLGDEFEHGDSVSKMYVSLLARHLVQVEPLLMYRVVKLLKRCGLKEARRPLE